VGSELRPQRRGRAIAFTEAERDAFLAAERVCRIASVTADGPHVVPLWFVWLSPHMWFYSLTRTQRWADLERDPRVSGVVDAGEDYEELRGVEIRGQVEVIGEVPRMGGPVGELADVELAFMTKYLGERSLSYDGRHAWLRLTPHKITSWDFRKLEAGG
jgi:hypothetical protein